MSRSSTHIRFFTCAIIAFYKMFSSMISPGNCENLFHLFLITPVAKIHQRLETLCLPLRTESENCLDIIQKSFKMTRLRETHENNERQKIAVDNTVRPSDLLAEICYWTPYEQYLLSTNSDASTLTKTDNVSLYLAVFPASLVFTSRTAPSVGLS